MKRRNPYVGPRAFEEGDRRDFFGREREIRHLESLVIARRGVLLYAASGAGKTSLVKAGLIPRLRVRRQVGVLPMARVVGEMPLGAAGTGDGNLYVLNTLCDLLSEEVEREALWGLSLSAGLGRYFATRPEAMRARPHLLILDQFEELFTTHPGRYSDRADFFRQVRECLFDHPRMTLLLSMREEHIGELYPFEAQLPDRLRCRFRLELLGEEAARAAAVEPARRADVVWSAAAVRRLVDDLRTIRDRTPDDRPRERYGPYVEPVELQVVCRRLWERLPAGNATIDAVHLEAAGCVEQALADYYAEKVAEVAGATGVPQRLIRDWIGHHLITEQGIRAQVLRQACHSAGLATTAVDALVDAHLVRAVNRRGATWLELAHDRLIRPVVADNATWSEAHLSTLQRQAAVWEREGRPGELILRGAALAAAERWINADAEPLTPAERDFLTACRRARAAAQKRQRQARRLRRYAWVTTLLAVVAAVASLVALVYFVTASSERDQALVRGLTAQAMVSVDDRLDLALLLGVEVLRVGDEAEGRRILLAGLESSPRLQRFLRGHEASVWTIAFRPDGGLLASGGADGTIRLWDPRTGHGKGEPIRGHRDWVWSVAWSPDGKRLASAGRDRAVVVWDLAADPPRDRRFSGSEEKDHGSEIYGVGFSPDGRLLASAAKDGTVILWDVATGRPIGVPLVGHEGWVTSVAWSPDGRSLATGSVDETVILWQVSTRIRTGSPWRHDGWVTSVAWSPDGRILAAGSLDGTVVLWDPGTGQPLDRALEGLAGAVSSVSWSGDGRTLAAGNVDGTVMLWDIVTRRPLCVPLVGQAGPLRSVAFAPDGRTLASGNGPTIVLWEVGAESRLDRREGCRLCRDRRTISAGRMSSAALSRDGKTLAVGGWDSRTREPVIRLWDVANATAHAQALPGHGDRVSSIAWSPGDEMLIAVGGGLTVNLWNPITGQHRGGPLPDHPARVSSIAFHPRGDILAVGDWDGTVVFWQTTGGVRWNVPLVGHRERVSSLAFRGDGEMLASGSWDQTVRLWDVATGRETGGPLTGHIGPVLSLAFAPDGRTLASGSWEGGILLWDMVTGTRLGGLNGHGYQVVSLTFHDNGRTLISVDSGANVIRWDVDPESWRERACRIANRNLTVEEWRRFFGPAVAYRSTCPRPTGATGENRQRLPIR